MNSNAEYSVFCSNTLVIDRNSWNAFLSGLSVQQAIQRANRSNKSDDTKFIQVASLITTQYRNFEMLEVFLHHPKVLTTQLIFSLNSKTKMTLIQSYYCIEPKVVRELLGKKLTHRVRKELEDISMKTNIPILGCRRMFDNLKRIIKKVEDVEGDIILIIMNHFLLSKELASQYAHVIFINHYKLDTTKRKLSVLKFGDFEYVASVFLDYFIANPSSWEELDSVFIEDCRGLKSTLSHKDTMENLRLILLGHLASQELQSMADKVTSNAFKIMLRNIIGIGVSLGNSKEVRDLFLIFIEKIVESCISLGWTGQEFDIFVRSLLEVISNGFELGIATYLATRYSKQFARLLSAIRLAAARLFAACSI
ncbi:acidic fibroblast growth factor binding protein [Globomyces pollinis-pini]|nr:acidic fibroblast growth factor binding protein [Globomyces pollinis-pini]